MERSIKIVLDSKHRENTKFIINGQDITNMVMDFSIETTHGTRTAIVEVKLMCTDLEYQELGNL